MRRSIQMIFTAAVTLAAGFVIYLWVCGIMSAVMELIRNGWRLIPL